MRRDQSQTRDARCGMREANRGTSRPMRFFNRKDESVQLSAEPVEQFACGTVRSLVGQRPGFPQAIEVIDGFITRGVGKHEKPDEVGFIPAAAIPLDDVRPDRFRRPANLAARLEQLEFRQPRCGDKVTLHRRFAGKLPDLQVAVVHAMNPATVLPFKPFIFVVVFLSSHFQPTDFSSDDGFIPQPTSRIS
jgi:hypothetical protein